MPHAHMTETSSIQIEECTCVYDTFFLDFHPKAAKDENTDGGKQELAFYQCYLYLPDAIFYRRPDPYFGEHLTHVLMVAETRSSSTRFL